MNWKVTGIVTVSILCLIGLGITIYAAINIVRSIITDQNSSPLAQSRLQCNSANPDISIRGCSAILQSTSATDADRTYAHFQRGLSYEHKGDLDHAIEDDTAVIKAAPTEALAYNNRGLAYQRKNDLDHAIADYNQALQLVPELNLAWINRSNAYSLKGDYLHAIEDINHVIKLQPKNAIALNNRCYFRAIAGQLEDALADCNQSLLLKPGVGTTLDSRAFTYLKMKKYDLAIVDYDAAIGQDGNRAPWLYGRGLARRAKHDLSGSNADIAAALKIDPGISERFRKYGVS